MRIEIFTEGAMPYAESGNPAGNSGSMKGLGTLPQAGVAETPVVAELGPSKVVRTFADDEGRAPSPVMGGRVVGSGMPTT